MATPEDRLSAIEMWVNQNRDAVSMFTGLVSSVNGRLGTIAQRVATGENQMTTLADAITKVNDKSQLTENKATVDSGRIDAMEAGRTQVVNQLETIVNKSAADTTETHKAITAAIDQMQISVNTAQAQMMQKVKKKQGN